MSSERPQESHLKKKRHPKTVGTVISKVNNSSTSSFKDNLSEKQRLVIESLLIPEIYSMLVNKQMQDYLMMYKENKLLAEQPNKEESKRVVDPERAKEDHSEYINLSKVKFEMVEEQMPDENGLRNDEVKKVGFALGGLAQYSAGQTSLHNLFGPIQNMKQIEGFGEYQGSADGIPDITIIENICNGYLPICVFLSKSKQIDQPLPKLIEYFNSDLNKDDKDLEEEEFYEHHTFKEMLIESILVYNEKLIYSTYLELPDILEKLISSEIFSIFIHNNKYEYLQEFFQKYQESLKIGKAFTSHQTNKSSMEDISPATKPKKSISIDIKKLAILARYYFLSVDDSTQLLQIFKLLKLGSERILEILLHTKEEERVISIVQTNENLLQVLKEDLVLDLKAYKLLILLNKKNLINTFNQPVSQGSKVLVYHEMCTMIERGMQVESMSNIIIHVSETFWDYEKLIRFYRAINTTVRNSKSDWLLSVQNPLLFCIALCHFFKKLKEQLDYMDNEINDLASGMLNFCKIYIENASDETLSLNLLEKDTQGIQFLDYAFEVKDMNILETDQIEGLIYQMWDLRRHTMQTLGSFMRILNMDEEFRYFTLNVFTKDFGTPIESGDDFQLEFRYASNSVQMKIISEIIWPILLLVLEFIFSMQILSLRLRNEFTKDWIHTYYSKNVWLFYCMGYLRITYLISAMIKSLSIHSFYSGTHYIQTFHMLKLVISFLQLVVFPLFFFDSFWFINITQMLFVVVLVSYLLVNSLSLKDIGVVLRIFGRMGYVVVIFGTMSCLLVTVVAFPIHTAYLGFSQPAEGQIYKDLNLFADLYQGILTCFEFVFGAVVLVRPYTEQNHYTYSMTFIMMMFAFFGNIMLANMLVAFLTSQFDYINSNAKYLTLNMQFTLIKVFRVDNCDTLVSLPYPLLPIALPFYAAMIGNNKERRKRSNKKVRIIIHVLNVFIPTFIVMLVKLILFFVYRYVEYLVYLSFRIFKKRMNIVYLVCWFFGGIFLLIKLLFQDIVTLCRVMLSFKHEHKTLFDFELNDTARSNLVRIFTKFSRIINHNIRNDKIFVSYKQFLDLYFVFSAQEFIFTKFNKKTLNYGKSLDPNLLKSKSLAREFTQIRSTTLFLDDYIEMDFNSKYCIDERRLAPILLRKFAFSEGKNDPLDQMRLDMNYMSEKLKNNVNTENVVRLISFDLETQFKASQCLKESQEEEIQRGFKEVREGMGKLDEKLQKITNLIKKAQETVDK